MGNLGPFLLNAWRITSIDDLVVLEIRVANA